MRFRGVFIAVVIGTASGPGRLRRQLLMPILMQVDGRYLFVCSLVMLVQAGVGVLGFYYHTAANLRGPSPRAFDNFIYGAPALAPLLFPNLVLLAGIGLWRLRKMNGAIDDKE